MIESGAVDPRILERVGSSPWCLHVPEVRAAAAPELLGRCGAIAARILAVSFIGAVLAQQGAPSLRADPTIEFELRDAERHVADFQVALAAQPAFGLCVVDSATLYARSDQQSKRCRLSPAPQVTYVAWAYERIANDYRVTEGRQLFGADCSESWQLLAGSFQRPKLELSGVPSWRPDVKGPLLLVVRLGSSVIWRKRIDQDQVVELGELPPGCRATVLSPLGQPIADEAIDLAAAPQPIVCRITPAMSTRVVVRSAVSVDSPLLPGVKLQLAAPLLGKVRCASRFVGSSFGASFAAEPFDLLVNGAHGIEGEFCFEVVDSMPSVLSYANNWYAGRPVRTSHIVGPKDKGVDLQVPVLEGLPLAGTVIGLDAPADSLLLLRTSVTRTIEGLAGEPGRPLLVPMQANGSFEIAGIAPDSDYLLTVVPRRGDLVTGPETVVAAGRSGQAQEEATTATMRHRLELRIPEGCTADPLASMWVWRAGAGNRPELLLERAFGSGVIDLPKGQSFRVAVRMPDGSTGISLIDGDSASVPCELQAPRTFELRLVDGNGRPQARTDFVADAPFGRLTAVARLTVRFTTDDRGVAHVTLPAIVGQWDVSHFNSQFPQMRERVAIASVPPEGSVIELTCR